MRLALEQALAQLVGIARAMAKQSELMRDSLQRKNEAIPVGKKPEGRRYEELKGKAFEMFQTFGGGEAEWQEWSEDFIILVDTTSGVLAEAMEEVKKDGKKNGK